MRIKIFTMFLLMVAFAFNSYATNPISPEAADFEKTIKVEKKMNKATVLLAKFAKTKVGKWMIKKTVQLNKFLNKGAIDLNDPVDKWLWYSLGLWAISVVLSIVFSIIPGLWRLWYLISLVGLVGTICFFYWVYLKFLQ